MVIDKILNQTTENPTLCHTQITMTLTVDYYRDLSGYAFMVLWEFGIQSIG